jgi:hypothetical protein
MSPDYTTPSSRNPLVCTSDGPRDHSILREHRPAGNELREAIRDALKQGGFVNVVLPCGRSLTRRPPASPKQSRRRREQSGNPLRTRSPISGSTSIQPNGRGDKTCPANPSTRRSAVAPTRPAGDELSGEADPQTLHLGRASHKRQSATNFKHVSSTATAD